MFTFLILHTIQHLNFTLKKELGFSKTVNDFLHTENFVLVDGKGRICGIYNGTLVLEIKNLISDIKLLKNKDI